MKSKQQKPLNRVKICLVGSHKPYPAFDSVSSVLKEILGPKNVMELRINDLSVKTPLALKIIHFLLQDVALYFKIVSFYKRNRFNAVLMFQGHYPLTCIGLKISRIRIILYVGGSAFKSSYYSHKDDGVLNRILAYLNVLTEEICYTLSDLIIMPSEKMLDELDLRGHADKVHTAVGIINLNFFDEFKIMNAYKGRKNIVGYVGGLARSKGILNLFEGIRVIINNLGDKAPHFLIIGVGESYGYLKNKLDTYKLSNHVFLTGHMPHKALPKYYNEMKLLILPSYTEGLPSVILEAMACGTPVLATPVGAVPDVIRDGETGFLLNSNDPKHIADKIIEILNKSELLEKVSINAYNYVRENLSYEKTLESWRKIIGALIQPKSAAV
jgi:glycosyltransferase involved in cell wall biosynthesis